MKKVSGEQQQASAYRVKYTREEFLKLVKIADPQIIYRVERIHFFSYDGFVMYTFECGDEDFIGKTIIQCVEFTNTPWKEWLGRIY